MVKLSIVIPVYNERDTLLELVEKVKKVNLGQVKKEIIIVDDFSRDGTRDLLPNIKECKIFYHAKNMGKGAALREGFKHASGDIIVIQDADLEYDPNDFTRLMKPILEKRAKVVYGSRFLGKDKDTKKRFLPSHYIGNRVLSFITSLLFFTKITDMETCYKMFAREVIENINLQAKRFEIEPEITTKILKKGYKIVEIPISYTARTSEKGKKINWIDGIKAFLYLLKYRFE